MGPKVRAACSFVEQTGRLAAIGSIDDTAAMLPGQAGTTITAGPVHAGEGHGQ